MRLIGTGAAALLLALVGVSATQGGRAADAGAPGRVPLLSAGRAAPTLARRFTSCKPGTDHLPSEPERYPLDARSMPLTGCVTDEEGNAIDIERGYDVLVEAADPEGGIADVPLQYFEVGRYGHSVLWVGNRVRVTVDVEGYEPASKVVTIKAWPPPTTADFVLRRKGGAHGRGGDGREEAPPAATAVVPRGVPNTGGGAIPSGALAGVVAGVSLLLAAGGYGALRRR